MLSVVFDTGEYFQKYRDGVIYKAIFISDSNFVHAQHTRYSILKRGSPLDLNPRLPDSV